MPLKLPDRVFPHGLSTHYALNRLVAGIEAEIEAQTFDLDDIIRKATSPTNFTSLFPWTSAFFGMVQSFLLLLALFTTDQDHTW